MTAASNSDARKREAERAEQAARSQKSALGATNSPEAGSDAPGAVGAILTSEQREALVNAFRSSSRSPEHLAFLSESVVTAIVREHRAEVLAEVERRIEAWIRHGEAVPADVTTYERRNVHDELRMLIRDAKEQNR